MTTAEAPAGLVQLERTAAAGVWRLLLDRPPVNAFSRALYRACIEALDRVAEDSAARCLIVGSAVDGAFCGGADTKELAALTGASQDEAMWAEREAITADFLRQVESLPIPAVAAIDGYAIGAGFVLASLCDIRVASRRSWFAIPELAVHRAGGVRHAMRVLPQGAARQLYFARGRLAAERAYELGLVDELVEDRCALVTAECIAGQIAETPAAALREAKAAVRLMEDLPTAVGVQIERLTSRRMAEAQSGESTR